MTNSKNTLRESRFRKNDIISLLQVNRRFNLAESTSQDLHFDELVQIVGYDNLADLRLGYGSAQGLDLLREQAGLICKVAPDNIVTTT